MFHRSDDKARVSNNRLNLITIVFHFYFLILFCALIFKKSHSQLETNSFAIELDIELNTCGEQWNDIKDWIKLLFEGILLSERHLKPVII